MKRPARLVNLSLLVCLAALVAPQSASATDCMVAPTLECVDRGPNWIEVKVCAPGGAPAGFTLGWIAAEEAADGYLHTEMCRQSWTQEPYLLDAGECTTVRIEGGSAWSCCDCPEFDCSTDWVIHGYVRAIPGYCHSAFSADLTCSTEPCYGCTYTQGYWKNHPEAWPVDSLMLGDVNYLKIELIAILSRPVAGNGLVSLAHQLIAAKLNVAAGASDPAATTAITQADLLIGSLSVPPVGTDSLAPAVTSGLIGSLTDFNEGTIGPGHCEEEPE